MDCGLQQLRTGTGEGGNGAQKRMTGLDALTATRQIVEDADKTDICFDKWRQVPARTGRRRHNPVNMSEAHVVSWNTSDTSLVNGEMQIQPDACRDIGARNGVHSCWV